MDTRIPASRPRIEEEICEHLGRHATESTVVELARPMIRQALDTVPPGPLWLSLDWEDQHARLRARHLDGEGLPGEEVIPGLTRAHDAIGELMDGRSTDALNVSLNVARFAERDIDSGPADPGLLPDDQPAHLLGFVAAEMADGHSLEEAAARAGATVAEREVGGRDLDADARQVADLMRATERRLGGDFEVVSADRDRAVLRNRRCPFGNTSTAMCRFTSGLAGGMAVRAAGAADVNVVESLAGGDHECRVVVELNRSVRRPVSHHYTWPPSDPPEPAFGKSNRGFQVTLSMQLPRDRLSVPVTRHLIRAAMNEVGVLSEDADSVELAITEACANVIDHSGPGDAYDVAFSLGTSACHIRVVDVGRGFDHAALSLPRMADSNAEHGRGVALMHALVDQVRFESQPEQGTVVHLVKSLRFDESSTARRLMLESMGDSDS